MSDRIHSVTVVFEKDVRDDDAQAIIGAIKQLRGVIEVAPNIVSLETFTAESRARHELRESLFKVLFPDQPK